MNHRLSRPTPRESGQTLVLMAFMAVSLLLAVGLSVDVGHLMARRAKLQSAVDTAALSAAQMLVGSSPTDPTTKAHQIMDANGIPSASLSQPLEVTFPDVNQVAVRAVEPVDTFFMRMLPAFRTVDVAAEATADVNSYAEILAKPYGSPGIVNELSLMVWGIDSHRRNGDAYTPGHIGNGNLGVNPWYSEMPYGYLFRIDVPASYPSNRLVIQLWDPDTYNRPGPPPIYAPPYTPDEYASCTNPSTGTCTTLGSDANTGLKLDAFPSGRPAFWRVDEYRRPYYRPNGAEYLSSNATTTRYSLWHFNPRITTAFADPATLTDSPSGGPIATYQLKDDPATDLRWVQPPGFDLDLTNFTREDNGGYYFYLYVDGIAGSSENNYDIRVGPPAPANLNCSLPQAANSRCYSNQLYFDQIADPSIPDWYDGGALVFAKRALPLNLNTGAEFPLIFTQVSKNAAGQTLGVRHFDQDCNNGCGSSMQYQMQICGCNNLLDDSCWANIGNGWVGPNDGWNTAGRPDPETFAIPDEGSALYNTFFGGGACNTSWMRLRRHPSYSQDTTVWELPFFRPRLIR